MASSAFAHQTNVQRLLGVTVLFSPAQRDVQELHLQLPQGSTVADALQAAAAAALPAHQSLLTHVPDGMLGVWGRRAVPTQVLRDDDRVEVYRPLLVDPKVARRERFQAQGARGTGLFARKRPGAKAGY